MTKENLKASWQSIKGQLKAKYDKLTEQDLTYVEGKEEELYGRLQQKLGKTKAEVTQILESLHAGVKAAEQKLKH